MRLKSPHNLHYPVTVTALLKQPRDSVGVAEAIFSYYYVSRVTEGDEWGEEKLVDRRWTTNFECDVEGTISEWCIDKGTVLQHPDIDLVEIEETCPHSTQFGGLCALCGKDMTELSYAQSRPDTARANTNVAHAHKDLRISSEEASRMDQESKRKLLSSRKLSLVVDLDLTIIQATVDPTIGEWQNDEANPNYEAVRHVRSFELRDDALGRNVAYYVKMRPDLLDFLASISEMFELHIYTMGTRNYALEIAKIVDPDHKLFADRILSRTETPGEDSKNLRKLFPVDTKMVVIIDDRMDVWRNSPYLVKVTPYNFFTGIGDIHGSFLDKRYEQENKAMSILPADNSALPTPEPSLAEGAQDGDDASARQSQDDTAAVEKPPDTDDAALEQFVSMRSSEDPSTLQEKTAAAEEALAAQLSDRPLLQQQKALEKAEAEAEAKGDEVSDKSPPVMRHSLLQDHDTELQQLQATLAAIHARFYRTYENNVAESTERPSELRNGPSSAPEHDMLSVPDVKLIMGPMKLERLKNCTVVFTGVVPIGVDVHRSRFGFYVRELGGEVRTKVDKRTTHLIAAPDRPTHKVRAAVKNPKIVITTAEWLQDQWYHWWKAVDPAEYSVSGLPAPNEGDDSALDTGDEADENPLDVADDAQDPEAGSPQPEFRAEEWDDMDAQLADFLDSDDDETDGASTVGAESDDEHKSTASVTAGKRKRNVESDSEMDTEATSKLATDPKLQNRKRQAVEKTVGITEDKAKGTDGEDDDDDDDQDADFDAALEAELEAASDGDDDDDGDN